MTNTPTPQTASEDGVRKLSLVEELRIESCLMANRRAEMCLEAADHIAQLEESREFWIKKSVERQQERDKAQADLAAALVDIVNLRDALLGYHAVGRGFFGEPSVMEAASKAEKVLAATKKESV